MTDSVSLERNRREAEETRADIARRSGIDPERIYLEEWLRCEPWMEGRSTTNCGYALLNADDIPLPDHACEEVLATTVDVYLARDTAPILIGVLQPWSAFIDIPDDAGVFCIIERSIPGGSATLFGVTRPIPGAPEDDDGNVQAYVDECVIRTTGHGTDFEPTLLSWYDRLFRGLRTGRPGQPRFNRAELQAAFTKALQTLRRDHTRITVESMAREMSVSKSVLERAMQNGTIPRRKAWDSLHS